MPTLTTVTWPQVVSFEWTDSDPTVVILFFSIFGFRFSQKFLLKVSVCNSVCKTTIPTRVPSCAFGFLSVVVDWRSKMSRHSYHRDSPLT